MSDIVYTCEICGDVLIDYELRYCCNGTDCACRGLPIDPPWCDICFNKIMNRDNDKENN